ncbi:hypothetical protein DFH05DRAFT_208119 [Lentinula detonsa]|uniref:Uncharacterized protein n=1 Tax=Lentinula detonsa TaxID=2804962 RepID=A0A9W8NX25_9AGAR|nr:hypothetical protein DFH05DRAFT_208119 [Lentinula detonsa]
MQRCYWMIWAAKFRGKLTFTLSRYCLILLMPLTHSILLANNQLICDTYWVPPKTIFIVSIFDQGRDDSTNINSYDCERVQAVAIACK